MPKLYVGNTTQQSWEIFFRIPEKRDLATKRCPAGGQIMLYEGPMPAIEAIIKHFAQFGGVEVKDVDRTKDFIGHCWSIDKEIDARKIMRAIDHNADILEQRGHENRKNLTAAHHHNMNAAAQGAGLDGRVPTVETIISESVPQGRDARTTRGKQSIQVTAQGSDPKPRSRRKAS